MQVFVICQRVPFPPNKGEKIRTLSQINHLLNSNYQLSVFSHASSAPDKLDAKKLVKTKKAEVFTEEFPSKANLLLASLAGGMLSTANFYNPKLQKALDHQLSLNSPTVILCTSSSMAEYIFRSKSLNALDAPKPLLIMDFMDLDSKKWSQYATAKPWPMKWVYQREARLTKALEEKIHRTFDHSLFVAQQEVDVFAKRLGTTDKIHVVGNGLDTKAFTPSPTELAPSKPVFIFTGVMDYFPNEDAVLSFVEDAWDEVRKRWPGAEFIVAGMNPSPKIRNLQGRPGITITGFVEDILEYYHRANFFLAPFRIARGVQNKILQAFACGLPVISTPIGNEGIDAEDGTHLLIAKDNQQFVDRIEQLMTDGGLRTRLRENALELVHSKFTWAGQLKELDDILDQHAKSLESRSV